MSDSSSVNTSVNKTIGYDFDASSVNGHPTNNTSTGTGTPVSIVVPSLDPVMSMTPSGSLETTQFGGLGTGTGVAVGVGIDASVTKNPSIATSTSGSFNFANDTSFMTTPTERVAQRGRTTSADLNGIGGVGGSSGTNGGVSGTNTPLRTPVGPMSPVLSGSGTGGVGNNGNHSNSSNPSNPSNPNNSSNATPELNRSPSIMSTSGTGTTISRQSSQGQGPSPSPSKNDAKQAQAAKLMSLLNGAGLTIDQLLSLTVDEQR